MTYLAPHFRERSGARPARGLGLDLSSIGADLGAGALNQAADAATRVPVVAINRARIASVVDLGYEVLDTYTALKPSLFVGGLVGALVSGAALTKRRKNPEAVTLYTITGLVSAVVAWIARPAFLVAAKPPPEAANPNAPSAVQSTLAWADGRVAHLSATRPGWEGASLSRLMNDLGTGTMAPAIQTFVTKNTR